MRWSRWAIGLLLMVIAPVGPLVAQQAGSSTATQSLEQTRADLEALRDRYDQMVASSAYSEALRQQANSELGRINERLTQGDFRTGDRIRMRVQGEEKIPDTLVVEPGPAVRIPFMGPISLAGVLRSELEDHMRQEIGRFIQSPVVEAQALIRVSMEGSVNRPGFYLLPADLLIGDVIMAAGGPAADADLTRLQVKRGGQLLIQGSSLQQAIVEGRSLDQLNILAGDALFVPARKPGVWSRTGTFLLVTASTLLVSIIMRR